MQLARTYPQPVALLVIMLLLSACAVSSAPGVDASPVPVPTPVPTSAATPTPLPQLAPPQLASGLRGNIRIDGSSTVFPITEAAAREFATFAPDVMIEIGVSGTGTGFEKFCAGETTIANASRPIKQDEHERCAAQGIDYIEVPVAYDGITVVVHASNDWVTCIRLDELRRMWEPAAEQTVQNWNDIRPNWPARSLVLLGAGAESGTYDYFTKAVVGTEGLSRADYTGSEDDYVLAQGVARDINALGFFGYGYYREYADQVRALAIDSGAGCIAPEPRTIADGSYQPLARPLLVYVRADATEQPEVRAFMTFYLANGARLAEQGRSVALPPRVYELATARLLKQTTGSVFSGGSQMGISMEVLLALEGDS